MKYLLFLVLLAGCRSNPLPPEVMYGTHKVWMNSDSLSYQDIHGFGCGHIERSGNGYVYTAFVINWHGEVNSHDETTDWNSLPEAEKFVEQWCKP